MGFDLAMLSVSALAGVLQWLGARLSSREALERMEETERLRLIPEYQILVERQIDRLVANCEPPRGYRAEYLRNELSKLPDEARLAIASEIYARSLHIQDWFRSEDDPEDAFLASVGVVNGPPSGI